MMIVIMTALGQNAEPVIVQAGGTAARVAQEEKTVPTPPFSHPVVINNQMVLHGWFAYKTLAYGYGDGSHVIPQGDWFRPSCQSRSWTTMPKGWKVAPDTEEVRRDVVAPYKWSTHLMILYNESGRHSHFPAYRTASLPPAGERFGDEQPKLQWKTLHTGGVQYRCPWQCYQILIRTPIRGREENDSVEPNNGWFFSDAEAY